MSDFAGMSRRLNRRLSCLIGQQERKGQVHDAGDDVINLARRN